MCGGVMVSVAVLIWVVESSILHHLQCYGQKINACDLRGRLGYFPFGELLLE